MFVSSMHERFAFAIPKTHLSELNVFNSFIFIILSATTQKIYNLLRKYES